MKRKKKKYKTDVINKTELQCHIVVLIVNKSRKFKSVCQKNYKITLRKHLQLIKTFSFNFKKQGKFQEQNAYRKITDGNSVNHL